MIRYLRIWMIAVLLFGAFIFMIAAAADEDGWPEWLRVRNEESRAAQTPIEFYGKVVDLDGNPIEGAVVNLDADIIEAAPKVSPDLKGTAKTDRNGLFEVQASSFGRKALKGRMLIIENIAKDGYEFERNMCIDAEGLSFEYRSDDTNCHKPDKSKPVVFYMRKRGELTFVLDYTHNYRQVRTSSDTPVQCFVDVAANKALTGKAKEDWERRRNPHWDMKILMERDAEGKFWNVAYKTLDEGAGVFVSEKPMYIVPEEGYQSEWHREFAIQEHQRTDSTFYIVLRSRTPSIYALLEIEVSVSTRECINDIAIQVNPYGERNFEYKRDEIPWRLRKRLEKEAEEALSEGRLPEKPDLPKLIEEYRNKEDD